MWLDRQSIPASPCPAAFAPRKGQVFLCWAPGGAVWLELHFHGEQSVFTLIGFILGWF